MTSRFKSLPRLGKLFLLFRSQPEVLAKGGTDTDGDTKPANALPLFPYKQTIFYITTEHQANNALRKIVSGKVGFDTEYTHRRPTPEEQHIIDALPAGGAVRKNAILGWQIVELQTRVPFPVAWNNIGLRLVQIATDDAAYVLDMWKIRAYPAELWRVLTSPDIAKVGVGASNDVLVFWDDLRTDTQNVVDAGMMARLLLAENYPKQAYGPLSLKNSVADVLGYTVVKELTESDWRSDELTAEQKEYAAVDAIASLALYNTIEAPLAQKGVDLQIDIPSAWYTFNSKNGEPTRIKGAIDGSEIPWKTGDCTWYSGGKFIGYHP
ncbi:ribonuclease H-like domain-containing protein [Mycena polygramma]|nr:ribonuclease H-like domain-containing protein [Mycena polygramma]